MLKHSYLAYIIILTGACSENNPYKDRARLSSQFDLDSATASNTGVVASDDGSSTLESSSEKVENQAGAESDQVVATASDTKTVAAPESIPKASLSATEVICSSAANYPKFATEFAVLCLNGSPTAAFAALLNAPFSGTGTPNPSKIKSVDVNGVSEFIFATSFQTPKPLMTALTKSEVLNDISFVEGNATFTTATVSERAPAGGMDLGGLVRKQTVTVKVAIISITDISISDGQYVNLKDQLVVSAMSGLKPGEADNSDNILGNTLSFFIADGNSTKVVAVAHQQLNNRGQHAAAETSALALSKRLTLEGYNATIK